jgi:DNA mismatch repair protein MutL
MPDDGFLARPVEPGKPVKKLPPEVARKIAAGEVIDRPAAVIRELLDNSIDAGATKISVEIDGGGIDRIRVTDNGCGMTAEDLSICTETHTTSKISAEDDLLALSTLGFRGEALSSIQAVSRLEITTTRAGREAWKLELGRLKPDRLHVGTIVSIEDLFGNFPARRQFLKRASAETLLCRQIFTEKALAWPGIEFRFSVDGAQKLLLAPESTLIERTLAALSPKESETFFHEIKGSGEGFSFTAVLGSPDVVRADRRDLMVFVNGRRIMEYSLLQAMEYGCEGYFPNGGHPFGLLFVTIDPALVDFNIHPAKREARFRDAGSLHHAVSSTIRDFFRRWTIATLTRDGEAATARELFETYGARPEPEENPRGGPVATNAYAYDRPKDRYAEPRYAPPRDQDNSQDWSSDGVTALAQAAAAPGMASTFRYLGQVFNTFLAVEKNNLFYLVDQHAAHERILYDDLFSRASDKQELLVPYRIETDSGKDDRFVESMRDEIAQAGFSIENEGDGIWQVTAVPARWTGTQADLVNDLLDSAKDPASLVSHLYATSACRAACKAGDPLDDGTARRLVEQAFALAEPVCPHGRPLWIVMDEAELFARIKRI